VPTITDISPQKRDQHRVNVYVDNEFAFGVSDTFVIENGLHSGKELSIEQYHQLTQEVYLDAAFQASLRFLSFRPRSSSEMRTYLVKKYAQLSTKAVEGILERLSKIGYLNDMEFAQWWVQQRREVGKRWGPQKIKLELLKKGLAPEIIEQALSGSQKKIADLELIAKELPKLIKKYGEPTTYETRVKIMQSLARRGFSWENIKEAVEEKAND
jgi:regulatory protein